MAALKQGDSGARVIALQNALAAHGSDPGPVDGGFGGGTRDAVIAFQRRMGLTADGVVDPDTARALGLETASTIASLIPAVTVEIASKIVVGAPRANIEQNLPFVLNALVAPKLADKSMILMALATIHAETASFRPISEGKSQFNTSPGGPEFDLYDHKPGLGNQGPPDGANFKGRGFVQLTGRANYALHSAAIGLGDQLVKNPELANDPGIAARLLASFLKVHEAKTRAALSVGDLATARKLVNGGSHGLVEFTASFNIGKGLLPDQITVVQPAGGNA